MSYGPATAGRGQWEASARDDNGLVDGYVCFSRAIQNRGEEDASVSAAGQRVRFMRVSTLQPEVRL